MVDRSLERMIEGWDGLAVVSRHHRPTNAWIFIALHDDALGGPTGGTRIKVYDTPSDGLRDALRLAEGMTHKWAAIDLPFGGGKGVLALDHEPSPTEREALLVCYGRLVETLRGSFSTGQDLGTTTEDMLFLARHTRFVHGPDRDTGRALDPGPYTARGVFAGLRAAVEHLFGSPDLKDRRILVQGAGGVGRPLADRCARGGAELLLSDLDEQRVGSVAEELVAQVVSPQDVYSTPCDVYAPCAVGATLNPATISRLRCRIVAGAANNQLGASGDAELLHERRILYAPDYVINGGGALAFGLKAQGEKSEERIGERLDGLGATLTEIFAEAREREESPLHAARRRVERVLARARES